MIHILKELTIHIGEGWEQKTITLWLVAYGKVNRDAAPDDRALFLKALAQFCRSEGWLLDGGADKEGEEEA